MEPVPGQPRSLRHCSACSSRLAYDQRYCVECGARRGPLPGPISQIVGGIRERGGGVPVAGRLEPRARERQPTAGRHPHWYDAWAQAPRAAAAAVLSTLGFGAVVGSLVGGGIASPLQTFLVAVSPAGAGASLANTPGGADGGSQAGQTITEQATITQPGSGGGGAVIGGGSSGGVTTDTGTTPTTAGNGNLPPIKHVFVITLSNQGFQQTFGHPVNDPYLGQTLVKQGLLIPAYYAVAGGPLANEVAMISGQGPTPKTVENCPVYTKIVPGKKGPKGQVLGDGCLYPKFADTLAGQLTAAKLTWKLYAQTNGPAAGGAARARAAAAHAGKPPLRAKAAAASADAKTELCRPKLGSPAAVPTAQNPYAAWRNPFLYFDSVVGSTACPKPDVALSQLTKDLKRADTTPSLSWIVADVCDDGNGDTTVCRPGQPTGLAAADAFLKSVVPEILKSPAYKADGVLLITFDQAPQTGPTADPSSCCDTPTYPNDPTPYPGGVVPTTPGSTTPASTSPTTTTTTASTTTTSTSPLDTTASTTPTGTSTTPATTTTTTTPSSLGGSQTSPTGGGGQVGLLILSKYVAADQQDTTDYMNHFSLLGSIEDLFGLKRLGYAHGFNVATFGPAVFSKYVPGTG